MSIKRRFEYQYRRLLSLIRNISMPGWMLNNTFRVSLVLLIILIGVGYLTKISTLATGGYQVHDLENQLSFLQDDIQKVEVDIAVNSSVTNIKNRLTGTKLTTIDEVSRFNISDAVVAKR